MHKLRVGLEPDAIARIQSMALAEHGDHILRAQLGSDLNLGPGRLDHLDRRLDAVVGNGEVLRAHAINRRATAEARRYTRKRQPRAAGSFEFAAAVDPAGEKV